MATYLNRVNYGTDDLNCIDEFGTIYMRPEDKEVGQIDVTAEELKVEIDNMVRSWHHDDNESEIAELEKKIRAKDTELEKVSSKKLKGINQLRKLNKQTEEIKDMIDIVEFSVPPLILIAAGIISILTIVIGWYLITPTAVGLVMMTFPNLSTWGSAAYSTLITAVCIGLGILVAMILGNLLYVLCSEIPYRYLKKTLKSHEIEIEVLSKKVDELGNSQKNLANEIKVLECRRNSLYYR